MIPGNQSGEERGIPGSRGTLNSSCNAILIFELNRAVYPRAKGSQPNVRIYTTPKHVHLQNSNELLRHILRSGLRFFLMSLFNLQFFNLFCKTSLELKIN